MLSSRVYTHSLPVDLSVEPTKEGFGCRLKTGTLKDLLLHANMSQGRVLNGLEFLNLCGCRDPDLPLATNDIAWVSEYLHAFLQQGGTEAPE